MNELIDVIKQTKNCLCTLQKLLSKENKILLKNDEHIKLLDFIIKKKDLFKKFQHLQKKRLLLEEEHNISAPYINNIILHTDWKNIINLCILLRSLNLENKKILNEKFYINQRFLELLSVSSQDHIYDSDGNLKF